VADNTVLNSGTGGDTIASDDVAGVKYQRVKISVGADGAASDNSTTAPLAVKISDGTDVALVDASGNLQVSLSGTAANGTAVKVDGSAVTQPVSIAATVTVDASGTTVPVDTELTTADLDTGAGTDTRAVVGLVGAKSGGGVLIPGDATKGLAVDLTATGANTTALKVDGSAVTQPVSDGGGTISIDDGAGNISVDWAGTPPPIGAGTEAAALRVTVATDSTGVLSVDDNGASLTVDNGGTFAVQAAQSGTWTVQPGNTANTTAWKVDASSVAVPVTDNSGSLTVDNAGTFATQATLQTGTNSVGKISDITTSVVPGTGATNLGKAEDAAHSSGDTGVMVLGVRAASPTDRSSGPTDGDYEPLALNEVGAVWTSLTPSVNGGLSTFMASGSDGSSILVATAQAVKASAGALYGYYAYNPESAVTFVHFYNTAAASVTVGTTNPLFTIAIPATSAANLSIPHGITFSNAGWSVAATTTAGGNTAPATGVSLVVWYK